MKAAHLLYGWMAGVSAGLIACLSLLCLTGCGDAKPVAANPDRARVALKTALETWKKGKPYESLKAATPPIHVSDSEWHGGHKLVEFELGAERSAGFGWRCEVQLTVEAKDGGARKHLAVYRVDTEPAIVVVHEE
ncbi:MAG: hypothetical protein WD872_09470 [Pirellulaceae bacterium]